MPWEGVGLETLEILVLRDWELKSCCPVTLKYQSFSPDVRGSTSTLQEESL